MLAGERWDVDWGEMGCWLGRDGMLTGERWDVGWGEMGCWLGRDGMLANGSCPNAVLEIPFCLFLGCLASRKQVKRISGMGLLRQFYTLPHCVRHCK